MKWLILVASLAGACGLNLSVMALDSPCPGMVPDYIALASENLVGAQSALCRSDAELSQWREDLSSDEMVINRIVSPAAAASALRKAAHVEFRGCRFREALYLRGRFAASATFRGCEFQGDVELHGAETNGELTFEDCVFHHSLRISDSAVQRSLSVLTSILAGPFLAEGSRFDNGIRVSDSRLSSIAFSEIQSTSAISLKGVRVLGRAEFLDVDFDATLRFRECEFDRSSVVQVERGTIRGGIRFDGCRFDGEWLPAFRNSAHLTVRLEDLTSGAPVIFGNVNSGPFPLVRISRSVIPFLKLPPWRLARGMIVPEWTRSTVPSSREMEDVGEILQLARSSYEVVGLKRDAIAARDASRIVFARLRGGPAYWIRVASTYFGSGLWWFVSLVALFAIVFWIWGRAWSIYDSCGVWERGYHAVSLSVVGLVRGPPDRESPLSNPRAVWTMRVARFCGILFVFLLGLVIDDWLQG